MDLFVITVAFGPFVIWLLYLGVNREARERTLEQLRHRRDRRASQDQFDRIDDVRPGGGGVQPRAATAEQIACSRCSRPQRPDWRHCPYCDSVDSEEGTR